MAFKNFSGILLDPDGNVCAGDRLRFTQQTITGQVLAGAVSYLDIAPDGGYSIDLQYGIILVDHYDSDSKKWRLQGAVTVNENTKATTLPELLGESTPPTDEQIKHFESLLEQTKEAAAAADVAALAARASALAAEDSEKAAAKSAADAAQAAADVANHATQVIEQALQAAASAKEAKEAAAAAKASAEGAKSSAGDAQDAAAATAKDATAAAASSASASKSAIAAADSAAAAAISAGSASDAALSAKEAAAGVALNAQQAKEAAAAAESAKESAEYNGSKAEAAKEEAKKSEETAKLSEIKAVGAKEIAASSAASAMEDATKAAIAAEFVAGKADIIKDQALTVATATTKAVQSAVSSEASAKRAEAAAGSFFSAIIDAGDFSAAMGEYPAPETPDMSYIWRCIEGGTINEVRFAVNDFLIYSAAVQEFTKIGGGSSGASFIDDLPIGEPWVKCEFNKTNTALSQKDRVVASTVNGSFTDGDLVCKANKEAGTVGIIFRAVKTYSNPATLKCEMKLPQNCRVAFPEFKNNQKMIVTEEAEDGSGAVSSEAKIVHLKLGAPTSSSTYEYLELSDNDQVGEGLKRIYNIELEIPVLWDGETLEAQQDRSATSYRQAVISPDPQFDTVAVIPLSTVIGSNLLFRYYDNTEIRVVGEIQCTADADGNVEARIAIPTAFNFLFPDIFDFCGFFIDSKNEIGAVVLAADDTANVITLKAKAAPDSACRFFADLTIPIKRK